MKQISLRPAREQVADALRKAIFLGEIRPGSVLTQETIAQQLGVSRMPVREAFQLLAREGLLVLQTHRRAVVREITRADVIDHYRLRSLLEAEAAARASENPDEHDDILAAHEAVIVAYQHTDVEEYVRCNESFHRAIWSGAQSNRLEGLLDQLWNGLPPHLPELFPPQMDRSVSEHEAIVKAIVAGDAEASRIAMQHHIERSLEDCLARLEAAFLGFEE